MALNLAERFEQVTGLDPSKKMVAVGLQSPKNNITYAVGDAESTGLEDQSVDLVIAGQAAHWFDHQKTWKELRRVLRPKGTVAYVVRIVKRGEAADSRDTVRSSSPGALNYPT